VLREVAALLVTYIPIDNKIKGNQSYQIKTFSSLAGQSAVLCAVSSLALPVFLLENKHTGDDDHKEFYKTKQFKWRYDLKDKVKININVTSLARRHTNHQSLKRLIRKCNVLPVVQSYAAFISAATVMRWCQPTIDLSPSNLNTIKQIIDCLAQNQLRILLLHQIWTHLSPHTTLCT
jgi:hypothetical protein